MSDDGVPSGTDCDGEVQLSKQIGGRFSGSPLRERGAGPRSLAKNPHEAYFFYYQQNELQAVRSGRWKLMLPHTYRTLAGRPGGRDGVPAKYEQVKIAKAELYNLESDTSETTNVADGHPDIVRRLEALAEQARAELGDSLTKRSGAGVREPGRLRSEHSGECRNQVGNSKSEARNPKQTRNPRSECSKRSSSVRFGHSDFGF